MPQHAAREPLVPLLLVLTGVTGLIDAVSVLGLGKVFTANMTGNVVFLGFAIAGVPGFSWSPFVVALLCFALGATVAGRSEVLLSGQRRRWLVVTACIEGCLLLAGAGVAAEAHPLGGIDPATLAIIALTGAAMGVRNATVRALKVPDLTTTVLTLTITGLAADSRIGGGKSPNLTRRILAVLAILVGASLGAALLRWAGLAAPLALAGLLTPAVTVVLGRR
jgi:uncharacterized membrane protein YoaK (UPF0700 family)